MKLGIANLAEFTTVSTFVKDKVHNLGQKPQAAVGSKRAIRTEENRFTALLSRIGFPAMCFTSSVGLLTTMPVFSSKPRVEKKPREVQNPNDLIKNTLFPPKEIIFERSGVTYKMTLVDHLYGERYGTLYYKRPL